MVGEDTASGEAKGIQADEANEGRDRSSISFPYNNLNDAVDVAKAIHANVGSSDCDDSQLAVWLGQSPKSSGYRIQLSASRMFGLIETVSGRHKLNALGKMVVDPQREREARAKAFMNVPLYSRVYEQYKGGVIPPAAAFERDIVGLGVSEKQKGRARQVFEKSAEQAGFFEHGKNRLVMPGITARQEDSREDGDTGKGDDNGNGSGKTPPPPPPAGPELHPFIQGLLNELPDKGRTGGQDWPADQRKLWLSTAESIFKMIYKDAAA